MNPARKASARLRLAIIRRRMTDIIYNAGSGTGNVAVRSITATTLFQAAWRVASPSRLAVHCVAPQAKSTTEIELTGIRTAQITGDNIPAAANETPIRLYRPEIPK